MQVSVGAEEVSYGVNIGFDGYIYLSNVFVLMGLRQSPLPYNLADLWTGEAGKERRALAKDVADFIQKEFL